MDIKFVEKPIIPRDGWFANFLMKGVYGKEIEDLADYPRKSGKGL